MIKAVIFDSDGMLTYDPGFSRTYAAKYGIPLEEITPFFTGPFKDCLIGRADLKEELQNGWLSKWKWHGTTDEFLSFWFSVWGDLEEEVFKTIHTLKEKGILCLLATNQEKYRTEAVAKKFGYHDTFDKIFSSAYVGHKKPHAEFFQHVFEYLKEKDPTIEKENIIFWDDDEENVAGAKAFGIHAEQYVSVAHYDEKMREFKLI